MLKKQIVAVCDSILVNTRRKLRIHNVLLLVLVLVVFANYQNIRGKFDQNVTVASNQHQRLLHARALQQKKILDKQDTLKMNSVFCDLTDYRFDICYLKEDVRVSGVNASVAIFNANHTATTTEHVIHRIRPYTRKWETQCMQTVGEVTLRNLHKSSKKSMPCDVRHSVPAVIFSTGGYTGNLFHDFTDGLVPLFITSQRFRGEVVFMILDYKGWWMTRYARIIRHLSHYPVIDFDKTDQVHCFREVVVGLRNHGDLHINPSAATLDGNPTIYGFQQLLKNALSNATQSLQPTTTTLKKPKLVLMTRNASRVLLNQNETIEVARRIGFEVEILAPGPKTDLRTLYETLHAADVLVGVHGAALTHFLFMKPGSTFIQIVPLGLDWPSRTYFGKAAVKAGFDYIEYKVVPSESTLLDRFGWNHTFVRNDEQALAMGWWEMKKVYLDSQDIRLSLSRFEDVLQKVFKRASSRKHIRNSSSEVCC